LPRSSHFVALAISIGFPLISAPLHSAEEWKRDRLGMFGPMVSFPPHLIADPYDGGEGRFTTILRSEDGAFKLTFFGFDYVSQTRLGRETDTLRFLWKRDLKIYRGKITYRSFLGRSYVIVARHGPMKLFLKQFGAGPDSNGSGLHAFEVEFPRSRHQEFDPWLKRIETSYIPFLYPDRDYR
jgi:hypothetical protein